MSNKIEIRCQLRLAVRKLDARGLQLASKWACEQLVGMESETSVEESDMGCSSLQYSTDNVPTKELDLLLFARSLITNGEYQRCSLLLRRKSNAVNNNHRMDSNLIPSSGISVKNSKLLSNSSVQSNLGLFLSVYSMYMAGEKLKEQQQATNGGDGGTLFPGILGSSLTNEKNGAGNGDSLDGKSGKNSATKNSNSDGEMKKNPFLNEIFADLWPLYVDDKMDGFLSYIFAVVVRDLVKYGQTQGQGGCSGLSLFPSTHHSSDMSVSGDGNIASLSAYELFIKSIRAYPWNWYVHLLISSLS